MEYDIPRLTRHGRQVRRKAPRLSASKSSLGLSLRNPLQPGIVDWLGLTAGDVAWSGLGEEKDGVLEVVWCVALSAVYPVVSTEPRVVLCVLSLAYCRV